MSSAEDLRTLCVTTPGMNPYQPIMASAVEICSAATLVKISKAEKLAAHVVQRPAFLINGMALVPISPEIMQALETFKKKLDRHIEQMPVQSGKKAKLLLGYKFNHLHALLGTSGKSSAPSGILRSNRMLELASLSTRAAGVYGRIFKVDIDSELSLKDFSF
ncbi:hypothetical protein C8R44DRAFT_874467 [Mycena epipterygia]|nr:hypothetical protein C8R44DRAFT_874462 [Mycena epipterygia]KAJ7126091.1 hypothetical protein C8R44DRAFT_874467 [Mycena epipterygia]